MHFEFLVQLILHNSFANFINLKNHLVRIQNHFVKLTLSLSLVASFPVAVSRVLFVDSSGKK